MEKRIQNKINGFMDDFTNTLKESIETTDEIPASARTALISLIFNHPRIELSKEDFNKRKRVKNIVPSFECCIAIRANRTRCTRRRNGDCGEYCGTHYKGVPFGIVSDPPPLTNNTQDTIVRNVCAQDIRGIIYYVDDTGGVYDPNDVITNRTNPRRIASYILSSSGEYSIPEFNI